MPANDPVPPVEPLLRPAIVLFTLLALLTGLAYPLFVTLLAGMLFPGPAGGSLITSDGQWVGSELVGQPFDDAGYFWPRPSATGPAPYNGAGSGGSNLGPLNPALTDAVKARIAALKAADPGQAGPVPVDLVTASASGLDPHITPAAARYQLQRVARARGMPRERVESLLHDHVERPLLGFIGEARVNVLKLNLALDALSGDAEPGTARP